jgi:MoxR-like ATPase
VFNQQTGELEFKKGPIFANQVLIDEAPRLTDLDGFLQPAQEGTVTVEALNEVFTLPEVRTIHMTGNPLPNGRDSFDLATLDRIWAMVQSARQTASSYQGKLALAFNSHNRPVEAQTDPAGMKAVYDAVQDTVVITPENQAEAVRLWRTVLGLGEKAIDPNKSPIVESTRPLIHLLKLAQAGAFYNGQRTIGNKDLAKWAVPVLAHRIAINRAYRDEHAASNQTSADLARNLVSDAVKDFAK